MRIDAATTDDTFYAAIILRCTRIQPEHDVGGGGEGEGEGEGMQRGGHARGGGDSGAH
jgi:hypothetical protein